MLQTGSLGFCMCTVCVFGYILVCVHVGCLEYSCSVQEQNNSVMENISPISSSSLCQSATHKHTLQLLSVLCQACCSVQ